MVEERKEALEVLITRRKLKQGFFKWAKRAKDLTIIKRMADIV